jgi:RNA polymerase sigma-B factor
MATGATPADRFSARQAVIELHWRSARQLAGRFRDRGEPIEDLHQVAAIGLIKAVDGFDLERGTTFASYLIPTVLGELRRHFRDKGWNVRVPRRLQELRADLRPATERLTHDLGRTPRPTDLAEALGTSEEQIREALAAGQAYTATSLQRPVTQTDGATLADHLGDEESGYDEVETRQVLQSVVSRLPDRERRILGLRFYRQLTQSEIADEIGMSQMHVSRLLSRSLTFLRDQLTVEDESNALRPTG